MMARRGWLVVALVSLLGACGGNDDPVLEEINEDLEVDIDRFSLNKSELYPGETVHVRWRTEPAGAFIFDARLYISRDDILSGDDKRVVNEECGVEYNDHCAATVDVKFECKFLSDNSFDCKEDGDMLQRNDLTDYFDQLPFEGYLILELCGEENCDKRAKALTFY
ncbi:hypothetical protein [Parahaliea mediterranea]|uniref:Uncharacterized protein n=1 Tax=Parahaliea mediterranea TaxID=651086 RepID=A0A939DEH9_9GAMM|nr:hypothetical protein [Parahaliea mediterranea]MBN7796017.1 hypothetical protein [Parahaliea mediterranea]